MIIVRFNCRVITPMFIGNATSLESEIRPSAITGMMRFWWRAMNAPLAAKGIYKLRNTEEKLFGGVGDSVTRSSFDLWVENLNGKEKTAENLLADYDVTTGLAYLLYTLKHQNKNRLGFEPKSTSFDLVFSFRDKENLKKVLSSFWLSIFLGGFGTRARRGAGCLKITDVDFGVLVPNDLDLKFYSDKEENAESFFSQNYKRAKDLVQEVSGDSFSNTYSHLEGAKIRIHKGGHNDWGGALNNIGDIFQRSRGSKIVFGKKNEAKPKNIAFKDKEVLKKLKGKLHTSKYNKNKAKINSLDAKAAFGLPIQVMNVGEMNLANVKNDENHRSSPIVISCIFLNNKFHWTVTHLQGNFLPSNSNTIKVTTKRSLYANGKFELKKENEEYLKDNPFQKVDNTLLNYFLNQLNQHSHIITL